MHRVGSDAECTHRSIQEAVTAAAQTEGMDEIRVALGAADEAQQVVVAGQSVTIKGGYLACGDNLPGLLPTRVSGHAGDAKSVFAITGPGRVRLENLHIVDGDAAADGGGISFQAGIGTTDHNLLEVAQSVIEGNSAGGNGGGISVVAAFGRTALVVLEGNTVLAGNEAKGNGGALAVIGEVTLHANAVGLRFHHNDAGRNGGAIYLEQPAAVSIGSAPSHTEEGATFLENRAQQNGGAIHVEAPNRVVEPALLWLYSVDGTRPLSLVGNEAGDYGGAISARGALGSAASFNPAQVCSRNINISDNTAYSGAALWMRYSEYHSSCPIDKLPGVAADACEPRSICSRIERNQSAAAIDTSIIQMETAVADFSGVRLLSNRAGRHIIDLRQDNSVGSSLSLTASVVADNHLTSATPSLIHSSGEGNMLFLHQLTLAGNTILAGPAAADVFRASVPMLLLFITNSIVYQPGMVLLPERSVLFAGISDVLLHELPRDAEVEGELLVAPPRFAGPDYTLRSDSPAVDFAGNAPAHVDIDGNPRPVDLPEIANRAGAIDLGAYELQQAIELFADGFELTQ